MNRFHEQGCRCVCCDREASKVWLGMIAVMVAILFAAAAGWLHDW